MNLLLIIAVILSTPASDVLLKNTSIFAEKLHQKCIEVVPTESAKRSSLASLICGKKITDENLKTNLQKTSLLHIFVISGSHLILFDELLSALRVPFYLRILFLGFYSLATGWDPPAVRALIALALRFLFKQRRLFFPSDLMLLIAGMVTLTLFPAWWTSLSFVMSWCASLALCWGSILNLKSPLWKIFCIQCGIYFFMILPLWGLSMLHPLSLIFNIFLAPLVSHALLPLAGLSLIIPPLIKVFDFCMGHFEILLALLSEPVLAQPPAMEKIKIEFLWLWILSWHLFFHFLRLQLYQGKDSQ